MSLCKYKATINFYLTPNPEKGGHKIFQKKGEKNLIFGHFGSNLPYFGETKIIFLKNWVLSVFRFYNYLLKCKKS